MDKVMKRAIIADEANFYNEKVLNTLTSEKRKKLSKFFHEKTFFCTSCLQSPIEKRVYFFVKGDFYESANSLFKNLRSTIRYFLSRGKVNNIREFYFKLWCYNPNDKCFTILLPKVSSNAFFSREDNEILKIFSRSVLGEWEFFRRRTWREN